MLDDFHSVFTFIVAYMLSLMQYYMPCIKYYIINYRLKDLKIYTTSNGTVISNSLYRDLIITSIASDKLTCLNTIYKNIDITVSFTYRNCQYVFSRNQNKWFKHRFIPRHRQIFVEAFDLPL